MSALGAGLLLAGIDLVGAYFAKRAAEGSTVSWVLGGLSFLVLFGAYVATLQRVELAVGTLAWIVILQVGVVVMAVAIFGEVVNAWQTVGILTALAGLAITVGMAANPIDTYQ